METVMHKINAVLCALAGVAGIILAIAVARLTHESVAAGDMMAVLSPDQLKMVPYIIAFCVVYGIAGLLYGYCRFFWDAENNRFLRFFRKWPVYIVAVIIHGMSLVWILPVLFNATMIVRSVSFTLGVIGLVAVVVDVQEYVRQGLSWVWSALRTKVKKKS